MIDTDDLEQVIKLDTEGVHIIDSNVANQLKRKNLSPSMITSFEQCPAKWIAETFATKNIMEFGPEAPTRRGSLFHKIMEMFFSLSPEKRNQKMLKSIMIEALKMPEFEEMRSNKETMNWLKEILQNYFKMGSQPQKVKIANLDINGRDKRGLEVFIKGKVEGINAKRNLGGFIDRVIETQDGTGVIVEDYKTSANVKHWKNKTKSNEGLAEQRQQIIYTELLKKEDINVKGARLIYPAAKEIVNVQLSNKELRKKVISTIEKTDENLDIMEENNTFEYGPSFLCAWCPIRKICKNPMRLNTNSEKIVTAYESQPDPEILEQVIEF